MSQYGANYDYDEPWVSGALDLCIETLTGTAFEIRVAPTDTIMSIKTKIQRVEGIPVAQQHLLFNLTELNNSASIQDYGIQNGATLKLILSMRGGPISTRRLPPADEAFWRDVQEWMTEGRKDDPTERFPSASTSKTSILVFRDGDAVNLFRVVENDDGTYSPLAQSWSPTVKNALAKDEPADPAKRLLENWVTMGKMAELKDKLEKLSIIRKEKKPEDEVPEPWWDALAKESEEGLLAVTSPSSDVHHPNSEPSPCISPTPHTSNSSPCDVAETEEAAASCSPLSKPLNQSFLTSMRKARKEADNIIRLQSKSLSVVVEGHGCANFKKTPLPDIRRSPRPELLATGDKVPEEKNELRGKTGSRMAASSFAIVEEESDMAAGSSMCSSQSSLMALPGDDMVVTISPSTSVSRDHGSSSGRFRISRYVVENTERPESSHRKLELRDNNLARFRNIVDDDLNAPTSLRPSSNYISVKSLSDLNELRKTIFGKDRTEVDELRVLEEKGAANDCQPSSSSWGPPSLPALPESSPNPTPKKRTRCLVCKKRLNITNTHTCRCSGIFCSLHRYSETHDCHFDYKEQGKQLLRLANPLVTAPKLPKL